LQNTIIQFDNNKLNNQESAHYAHNPTMSSLTSQESSETQPSNPVNPGTSTATKDDPSVPFKVGDTSSSGISGGTVDKVYLPPNLKYPWRPNNNTNLISTIQTSVSGKNASDTSEQRRGEDTTYNSQTEKKGSSSVGRKTGSESLIESIEGSVHERGEAEHSRAV
jgi:hypothetical protein